MTALVTEASATNLSIGGLVATTDVTIILLLVALLILKEVTLSVPGRRSARINRVVDVGLVPLLIVYGCIVAVRLLAARG